MTRSSWPRTTAGVGAAAALYALVSLTVDGFSVPASVLALGVIIGMTYGLLAIGLVLVHRSTGIINFAHSEVGTFAASLFGVWVAGASVGGFGLPYWAILPLAMAAGAGAGLGVEALAVRRHRRAPNVMSIVMTLGVATFLQLAGLAINTRIRSGAQYPTPPWLPTFNIGALTITPAYSAMLLVTPVIVVALALFLNRSRYGIALRASADNRDAAQLAGIPAGPLSSLAWVIAGSLSAFVAILQFPAQGFVISGAALGPGLLVRALVAAVIARMSSLPVAFLAGIGVGVLEQVTTWNVSSSGLADVILLGVLLAVLLLRSEEGGRESTEDGWASIRPWAPTPEAWRSLTRVRLATPIAGLVALLALVLVGTSSNRVALAFTLVVGYSLVALSVYVITGMVGQISLGQFAVAGMGAIASVLFVEHWLRSLPLGILVGGATGAGVSLLIGLPALRVRGLMLAVTTLGFAVTAQAWVFAQSWSIGAGREPSRLVILDEPVRTARSYFLFTVPFLLGGLWLVRNLSASGFGQRLRATRDNEDAARALGVRVVRVRMQAFAVAGFLAGAGGAVYAHGLPRLSVELFGAATSVTVVAITLIGGVSVLVGPLIGALYLLALPALVRLDEVGLAASTLGWVVLLAVWPGGLAQAAAPLHARVMRALAGKAADEPVDELKMADQVDQLQGAARRQSVQMPAVQDDVGPRPGPLLEARGLRRSFGGIIAVDGVDLIVNPGEIVGLLGPNGAGKTTLFELLGGFTRADAGSVWFDGQDISALAPEARSRLGLVRSFQDARLFPTFTVQETLELACERHAPSGALGGLVAWPADVGSSRDRARLARDLVETMGLGPFRDRAISELSTGTRRIVELGAVAAVRPRLLLLDEPASGIAQRETEALGGLLLRLRELLDATIVVIEHDISLLLSIADRMVAMELGAIIADGPPEVVRDDPRVVASYLGASAVAIQRSGPTSAVHRAAARSGRKTPIAAPTGPDEVRSS